MRLSTRMGVVHTAMPKKVLIHEACQGHNQVSCRSLRTRPSMLRLIKLLKAFPQTTLALLLLLLCDTPWHINAVEIERERELRTGAK